MRTHAITIIAFYWHAENGDGNDSACVCGVLSLYSWQTRERRQRTKMAMREVKRIAFAHAQHDISPLAATYTLANGTVP